MKSTKMTRNKFIDDLLSIICSDSASSALRIEMITRMLDQYTENLANGDDTRNEPVLPLQRVNRWAYLYDNFSAIMLGFGIAISFSIVAKHD